MVARWRQWRQSCTTESGASCAAWTVFSGAPNDSLPYIIDRRTNDVTYVPPEYASVPFALPADPAASFLGLSYDTANRPHLDVDVANAKSEIHLDLTKTAGHKAAK